MQKATKHDFIIRPVTLRYPPPPTTPQANLSAPKSDPSNDPCFGWGHYDSPYQLVHYKHVAAAAASLLKDSFER